MQPVSSQHEIEIKFDLEPGDVADLRTKVLPELGAEAQGTARLLSVYFDTEKRALRKHGVSLRVRSEGDRFIQTVKVDAGAGAALSARAEWESDIETQVPDLAAAGPGPLAEILAGKHAPKRLRPLFETSIDRSRWTIATDAFAIEVALDEGQIRAGGLSSTVFELELALKRGAPAHLLDVARRISQGSRAKLGVRSTAERGHGLADGVRPRAFKAEPVALRAGMSTASAFQAIMRNGLQQFRLNEALLMERRPAGALHQARIAMRRLRSALSLFKGCVADASYAQITNRLRVISGKLGEARNLDVYLPRCENYAAEGGADHLGAARLVSEVESRREATYADVIATLESAGYRQLMFDLAAWVEAGPWLTAEVRGLIDMPIEDFAGAVLERRRRKIKKTGRHLKTITPRARHRIRIEAKKLRYAAEFFAGLVASRKGRRRHEAFVAAVQDLQACLGDLNDIQAGQALAAAIVRGLDTTPRANPRVLIFAAGHMAGRQAANGKKLLRRARKAYDIFAATPRFWAR